MASAGGYPLRLWVGLLILATTMGCASVSRVLPGSGAESEELRELRQRIVELEQRATMAEVEAEHLRRLLAEARAARGVHSPSPLPSPEPAAGPVEIIEVTDDEEVQDALGRTAPPRPAEEPRLEVSDLDPMIIEELPDAPMPAQGDPASSAPVAEPMGEGPSPQAATAAVTADGQALYDRGYTFFHQGRYLDAESTFQQFLAAFGSTDLADNAQFWIGEARYAREDLAGALAAYREVANRYPGANKVPDSRLKSADCLRGLGDLEGAVREYRLVIEKYPSTAAAAVAEERLKSLN